MLIVFGFILIDYVLKNIYLARVGTIVPDHSVKLIPLFYSHPVPLRHLKGRLRLLQLKRFQDIVTAFL
jgi:hypothetical protein